MQLAKITLEAHHCDNRNTYLVTFEGRAYADAEASAVAYVEQRGATHAFHIPEDGDLMQRPAQYPILWRLLNPACEHGMSASSCFGPQHYASDLEISQGW
jgi:hypothetical protein